MLSVCNVFISEYSFLILEVKTYLSVIHRFGLKVAILSNTHIKLLSICFVSSVVLELAKLIKEQYTATQAHHLSCGSQGIDFV